MKKFNEKVKYVDRIYIYLSTLMKLFRGEIQKIFLKKAKGMLFIGSNVKISHKYNIIVGKNTKFERNSEIQGLAINNIKFGDNVTVGANTMIRPSSYYGVELGEGMEIGCNSSIGPFSYIGCAGYIKIGNNVMIGPKVSMFAENHKFSDKKINIKCQGTERKGIIIEDNCWIGSNVVILDGVTIGEGTVVGAGTIVTKSVPKNSKVIDKRNKVILDR